MNHEDSELAQAIEAKLKELNTLLKSAHDKRLHLEVSVDSVHWMGNPEPFETVRVRLYRTLLDSQHA